MLKLHIGCGARLERDWHNIDLDPPTKDAGIKRGFEVMEIDVRKILPYGAGAVDLIYSEHFIEHLTRDEGQRFFAECARVLKSGGTMRISTPDMRALVQAYQDATAGDDAALRRWAAVGYFAETPARLVNECLTLWGHRFTYDIREIRGALEREGFTVKRVDHGKTYVAGMMTEGRPFCDDLIVEATKP